MDPVRYQQSQPFGKANNEKNNEKIRPLLLPPETTEIDVVTAASLRSGAYPV